MASPENYLTVNDNSELINNEKEEKPLPLKDNTNDARVRSIDDFLKYPNNKLNDNTNELPANESSEPTIATSPRLNINDDNTVLNDHVSERSECSTIRSHDNKSLNSVSSIPEVRKEHIPSNPIADNIPTTIAGDFNNYNEIEPNRQVMTPTIKVQHRDSPREHKESQDFQRYSDLLNQLAATIEKKDDEIIKLSEKLKALESKKSKGKHASKSSTSLASSVSSSSSVTSVNRLEKNHKKDKPKKSTKNSETDQPISKQERDVLYNLELKLNYLEAEVNHLRQADIDAKLSAQHMENKSGINGKSEEESIIMQLMVDHNLLKERLNQLRSDQKRMHQPISFEGDIIELKEDVRMLRNQNNLLQQLVKSSSKKSLKDISTNGIKRASFVDKFSEPRVSPYGTSRQSAQPIVSNLRTRRLSDSSSVLVEDPTPKNWTEPIAMNSTRPIYHHSFTNIQPMYSGRNRRNLGELDVDSSRTVTETSESDDQVGSTTGSDIIHDSFDRNHHLSFPFTPKLPTDLAPGDVAKFVRPGGKMSTGCVCFVGHLTGRRESCVGLELDEDSGNHDGVFEGVRYFRCRKNRGVFVSFHKIILAYKSL